jgi:hypothetical protein
MTHMKSLVMVAVAAMLLSLAATDEAQARHRRGGSSGSCGCWGGSNGSSGSWGSGGSWGGRRHGSSGSCGSWGGHENSSGSCGGHSDNGCGCNNTSNSCNSCSNCGNGNGDGAKSEESGEPHTANYQPADSQTMNRNTQRGHAEPNAPTLNTGDRNNTSSEYQAPREESNQKDSDSRRDISQQSSTQQSD